MTIFSVIIDVVKTLVFFMYVFISAYVFMLGVRDTGIKRDYFVFSILCLFTFLTW